MAGVELLIGAISAELSEHNLTCTDWNLSGNGLHFFLKNSGYFSELFESINIVLPDEHWQERLSHEMDWNLTISFKGAPLKDYFQLQTALKNLLNATFVQTAYGLKGRLLHSNFVPFVIQVCINSPVTKSPSSGIFSITSSKTSSLQGAEFLLQCQEKSPWQALFNLALGVISPTKCSSLIALADLYTKGERLLQENHEAHLIQKFRSMIREKEAPEVTATQAFLEHLRTVNIYTPDDAFILALQFLITAHLNDSTCEKFLREIDKPLKLNLSKDPLLKKIYDLLLKRQVPFSAITALIMLSGFCQIHSYGQESYPQFFRVKMNSGSGLRMFFSESPRSLLLGCNVSWAIKASTSYLLVPDQSKLLSTLYTMLLPTTPIDSSETQKWPDLAQHEKHELDVLVDRLIESENALINHLGLQLLSILSPRTSKHRENSSVIAAIINAVSCPFPVQFQLQLIESLQTARLHSINPFLTSIHRQLTNTNFPVSDWSKCAAILLLEDANPQIRVCAYPLVATTLQNKDISSIQLGVRLIPDLIKAKMVHRVTQLIKLLKDVEVDTGVPLQFDRACLDASCQLACALLQASAGERAAGLEPVGKIMSSLVQKTRLTEHCKQSSQTISVLIKALFDQKHTLLALDLFMNAISSSTLQQQPHSRLDVLCLNLCQELLKTNPTSAGFSFRFFHRHGIWRPSQDGFFFLIELLDKLLKITRSLKYVSMQTSIFYDNHTLACHVEDTLIKAIRDMHEKPLLRFLPAIGKMEDTSRLHSEALTACQKLPIELQKQIVSQLYILRKNAQPSHVTDTWLIKLFLKIKDREHVAFGLQLFEQLLAASSDLQPVAHLFERCIEAANAHPSIESSFLTLAQKALPTLISHLNFSVCAKKLLQTKSHDRTELTARYLLEKINQNSLNRKEAEELVSHFKALCESAVFFDHFLILEKCLLHPFFIISLDDATKQDLVVTFFEPMLERGLSYQIRPDQRLSIFTSFIQNHELFSKQHPAFRTCFLLSVEIVFKLLQEDGDNSLFYTRLTSCCKIISISQKHKDSKKSEKIKACIKLRTELNKLLFKIASDELYPEEIRAYCKETVKKLEF
jgi:hypothetical protein